MLIPQVLDDTNTTMMTTTTTTPRGTLEGGTRAQKAYADRTRWPVGTGTRIRPTSITIRDDTVDRDVIVIVMTGVCLAGSLG